MTKALDLVFFGTPEYAAVSLRRLLETPHRVRAVVTRPDKPRGRGQQLEAGPVKRIALDAGIEVLEPVSPRSDDFLDRLRALEADLGVVVAYGRILPRAALDAPRLGCINAHGSLLPLLRGAAPIERAILNGFQQTGVTIMRMNEGLDEGDIMLAQELFISPSMTGADLRVAMAELSAQLLVKAVDGIAAGQLHESPQDHAAATFAPPLKKSEAALHWSSPARDLALRVRAFAPRPGAYAFDGSTRIKILEARALPRDRESEPGTLLGSTAEGLLVACGEGALEILTLQPEGKRAMRALDYARGLRGDAERRRFDDGH